MLGTPGRDERFAITANEFQAHSNKLADTAHDFTKSGGVMDKKIANDIINTSGKVTDRWIGDYTNVWTAGYSKLFFVIIFFVRWRN